MKASGSLLTSHGQGAPVFTDMAEIDLNMNTARISPQSLAEGFERALLGAPNESGEQRAITSVCFQNQRLFFKSEIIGNERITAEFDELEITTHGYVCGSHDAKTNTTAVTDRERDRHGLVVQKGLGRAVDRGADFYLTQGLYCMGLGEMGEERTFRGPPSQSPIGAPFEKMFVRKSCALILREPIIVFWQVGRGLREPVEGEALGVPR